MNDSDIFIIKNHIKILSLDLKLNYYQILNIYKDLIIKYYSIKYKI